MAAIVKNRIFYLPRMAIFSLGQMAKRIKAVRVLICSQRALCLPFLCCLRRLLVLFFKKCTMASNTAGPHKKNVNGSIRQCVHCYHGTDCK